MCTFGYSIRRLDLMNSCRLVESVGVPPEVLEKVISDVGSRVADHAVSRAKVMFFFFRCFEVRVLHPLTVVVELGVARYVQKTVAGVAFASCILAKDAIDLWEEIS